jgi:preprotein translocase subunit YajC
MLVTDAFAQAAGDAPANPMIGTILNALPIVAMLVIFYFLLIRPQQQRQKQLDTMLKGLKKGDRVLTNGGIYGTVVGVDDPKVVVKIADDVKVEFAKSAIVQVVAETKP